MSSVFGEIKIATDLEQAVLDTLQLWFYTIARQVEIGEGIPQDSLPQPKSWITNERFDRTNTPLPTIVVINPGMAMPPKQEGDGSFRCFWNIGVGVFVSGRDRAANKALVRLYTAICRTIMLKKQSLGGYAAGVTWLDESYDDVFATVDEETIGAGQAIFQVEVDGVVNRYGAPAVPLQPPDPPDPGTQPGSTWPLVQKVSATVGIKED